MRVRSRESLQSARTRATPCALAAAWALLATVGAQEPAGVTLHDETTEDQRRVHGDARAFRAVIRDDWLDCELTMARPLRDGMFTCVELFVDCDDDAATGLSGDELRVRAAVGSRFAPSAAAAERDPLGHTRVSCTVLEQGEQSRVRWIHRRVEAPAPAVDGERLRFQFPLPLVKERAARYSAAFGMRIVVTTSCSDQPIEWLHTCADDGLPIEIDGDDAEWSGAVVTDPGDELHASASIVDLTQLRVDHGADALYVAIGLAEAGVAGIASGGDVDCAPSLTVLVEPQFPRYQEPQRVTLTGGRNLLRGAARGPGFRARALDRCVELRLTRRTGQNRLRVIVHSDFVCTDVFEEPLRMDWSKK